ncbi:MAG: hypothetical protein GKR89_08150 [Candidatus Latescibacteria bacterium]|nr:hypothetical protein [Candidatus Latescibacterota bacterium]
MAFLHSLLGYIALLALAWFLGKRTRLIPWKTLLVAALAQFVSAGLLVRTGLRQYIFAAIGNLTDLLRGTALKASQSLLFSGVSNAEFASTFGPVIALEIASILIFVAAVSRMLYHYGVLPWFIGLLSRFMQRVFGISAAESVGMSANVFLGMTEAPLLIRPYIARMTESELFCLMTGGMATIAGTVMVVYASILDGAHADIAGHLFIASLISAPAAVGMAKLMVPETGQPETVRRQVEMPARDTLNGLDAAARGASEGVQLVINVIAMLIAFIGLVELANQVVGWVDGWFNGVASGSWSLQAAMGVLFRPLVWLMGLSWQEAGAVGELMGVKTVLNEFVAYMQLAGLQGERALADRPFLVAVYALCGFANFGSVAIMIGGIGGIAPERRGDLARLGLRSLVGGTLATMSTGCVIGLLI